MKVCYAVIINKNQRLLLNYMTLYLLKIFYEKQLYFALSRVISTKRLRPFIVEKNEKYNNYIKNVFYNKLFNINSRNIIVFEVLIYLIVKNN